MQPARPPAPDNQIPKYDEARVEEGYVVDGGLHNPASINYVNPEPIAAERGEIPGGRLDQ